MCGITGFWDPLHNFPVNEQMAHDMALRISTRGPDSSGVWCDGQVALAHRRLSIVDLSPAGHQPMISASGRYVSPGRGNNDPKFRFVRKFHPDAYSKSIALFSPQIILHIG